MDAVVAMEAIVAMEAVVVGRLFREFKVKGSTTLPRTSDRDTTIAGLFFFLFTFTTVVYKCSVKNARFQIRTHVLWCYKRPLSQLCRNRCVIFESSCKYHKK